MTLSYTVTCGKRGPSNGGAVLLGDDDSPFPKAHTTTTKYLEGSRACPGPTSHSLSVWKPVNHVGYTMALLLSAFSDPYVLYARRASGRVAPLCSASAPSS